MILACGFTLGLFPAVPLRADGDINLHPAQYLACGSVSVNGVVLGPVSRVSWEWGDETIVDSFFPAGHTYARNGDFHVRATAYLTDGSTLSDSIDLHIANAEDPLCRYSVRLYPETVLLRPGNGPVQLTLDVRDASGAPVSLAGKNISYSSSNPGVVSVNGDGVVSGNGFGEARVTTSVSGLPRSATTIVTAGEFRLEPAIILLTPGDSAQIAVRMTNADGTPAAGHLLRFFGGNAVASVTDSGLVTALRPPQAFFESPSLYATADGSLSSHNAVLVRVTAAPLGLSLHDYPGNRVSFRIAEQVASLPFGSLMTALQGPAVTDAVYALEQRLTGVTPNRGDLQFLVMDPGLDADGTVPCGLNGNPVRLGTGVDNLRSCLGGSDYLQWGVIAHELGHNFLSLNQRSFNDVVGNLPNRTTFIEGIATFLGFCSLEDIVRSPGAYSLKPQTALSLRRGDVPLTPAFDRRIFFPALASYEAAPNYLSGLTADVLDAILIRLYDEFGSRFAYRFFSAFVPSEEPQEINFATEGQRLAFWVAASSAAAAVDLKDRFQTRWAFPLDEAFYDSILPRVRALVERRGAGGVGPCLTGTPALCLNGKRFRVEVAWRVPAQGTSGVGTAVPVTGDTGQFWFFSSNNVELVIKVVDGRDVNGRFWVFYGALSDVEYTVTVTDTETGAVKAYFNPSGTLASVADTAAFEDRAATSPANALVPPPESKNQVTAARDAVTPAACSPGPTTLCANASRFQVQVSWRVPSQNTSGEGRAVSLTPDTGYFWFFSSNNVELVIKVVDGRGFNGRFWVFYGALSDVEYTITVTDTETDTVKTYFNPSGTLASVADTAAF